MTARALDHGVAAVGVSRGTHLGRLGEWAERATEAGVCFLAFVNTGGGVQTVAPPGTATPRLATNPISFGVPTFDALPFPIVYDGATSQVANGKIRKHAVADERLPAGWTTTKEGDSMRNPDEFFDGSGVLLPLGGTTTGYKGFGLAIIAELFSSIFANTPIAGETDPDWFNNAALFVAIDPLGFTKEEILSQRIETLASHIRSAEPSQALQLGAAAYRDEYLLPGEPEYRQACRHYDEGIELDAHVIETLAALVEDVGIMDDLPDDVTAFLEGVHY